MHQTAAAAAAEGATLIITVWPTWILHSGADGKSHFSGPAPGRFRPTRDAPYAHDSRAPLAPAFGPQRTPSAPLSRKT